MVATDQCNFCYQKNVCTVSITVKVLCTFLFHYSVQNGQCVERLKLSITKAEWLSRCGD
jgi:hypothetical protein